MKKKYIILFVILCFLHVGMQIFSIISAYSWGMAHFDNPNDKFEHMSDMWGAVAHILTFPMLTVLDKIGWHKTAISQLPFIGYVPLFLNSIIWVSVIFLVANKIIVLKRKITHTSDNTV